MCRVPAPPPLLGFGRRTGLPPGRDAELSSTPRPPRWGGRVASFRFGGEEGDLRGAEGPRALRPQSTYIVGV